MRAAQRCRSATSASWQRSDFDYSVCSDESGPFRPTLPFISFAAHFRKLGLQQHNSFL